MSNVFVTSGENSDNAIAPTPQLQGLFIPGIDNSEFVDGFGLSIPWGGRSTARRYGDYGISTDISRESTQLQDLASSLIPTEGGGLGYGVQGDRGPQGLQGPQGLPGIITVMGLNLPQNSNFVAALPHNIDQINALGTAADKLVYTSAYTTVETIGDVDLCVGTIEAGDLTISYLDDETVEITFDSSVELTSGSKYAIVVRTDTDEEHYIKLGQFAADVYANGFRWHSWDAGGSWNQYTTRDSYFATKANGVVKDFNPSDPSDITSIIYFYDDQWSAQSFIASSTYTITSVILALWKRNEGTTGTITVGIRDVIESYSEATWAEADLTSAGRSILDDPTAAAQRTTIGAGTGDSPTFTGLTLSGIAYESIDVDKFLVDSMGVIKYRTGAEVLSDIGASASAHLHDTQTLQHDAVNSDGGAFSFTTTGLVTFNQSIAAANYTAANLLTACATNAGALDFTAASKTLSVDETETISNYHTDSRAATWLAANHETTYTHTDIASNTTHSGLSSGNPHSVTPTELSLVIGTNTQAWDAGLDSLAGLGYVSDSMIKITAEDTYTIRTMAQVLSDIGAAASGHNHDATYQPLDDELSSLADLTYAAASFVKMTGANTFALRTIANVRTDLSITNVEDTQLSTWAGTGNITTVGALASGSIAVGFTEIAVDYTAAKCTDATADNTAGNQTSHADVLVDGDFGSNGLMERTGAGTYGIKVIGTDVQAYHANLAAIVAGTWTGAASITTLGTIATVGNITIADGGTIGQAAGPLLNFDNTNNYLEITGSGVIIGGTVPVATLGLTIEKDNVGSSLAVPGDSHLVLKNTNEYGQNMLIFTTQNIVRGGLRADWGGNFNWHASGSQGHQIYNSLDTSVCCAGISTSGLIVGGAAGSTSVTRLTVEGTITLKEQAAADADTAAYGQMWVKSDNPCTLWFTDDAGNDFNVAPQHLLTTSAPTFGGIVVANNGTIGQAAGPLLAFDDTLNYLEITGCKVGVGTATPGGSMGAYGSHNKFDIVGTNQCWLRLATDTTNVDVTALWLHPFDFGDAGWMIGTNNDGKLRLAYDAGSGGNEEAAITATKDGIMGITITTANKVGINDAAPASFCDVNGDINTTDVYKVDDVQVVSNQGAAVANATDADSTMARLNDLLARCRAHGLIAN